MADISQAVTAILFKRKQVPPQRSTLIGISGIDGSGKGFLTGKIVAQLEQRGAVVVAINVDGWLNLPHLRFDKNKPAEHFYEHAIRFDALFAQLILPLKAKRTHSLVADYAEETASAYRRYKYQFKDVDIIILDRKYFKKIASPISRGDHLRERL